MFEIQNKKKLIIGVIIVVVILSISAIFIIKNKEDTEEIIDFIQDNNIDNNDSYKENDNKDNEIEENVIIVHISGEVKQEGVIKIEKGARIIDAITAAGGTSEEADLSKVNLAYILEDAQKIYIPNINEKEEEVVGEGSSREIVISGSGGGSSQKEGKIYINLNTANLTELQKIPGVGEATATKIIEYRKANGKFNSIEEIKNIEGIGENKFNKLKNNIYVK